MTRHAHPFGEPPDDWRTDLQACALAIAVLVVLFAVCAFLPINVVPGS